MPTYEYVCDACKHEWELEQRMTDAAVKKCPKCGKLKAHRQISSGGNFILKGGGWYSDLYSSSGGSKKSAGSGSESKTETKSEPKTEAKSESKSEPKSDSKSETKKKAKAASE